MRHVTGSAAVPSTGCSWYLSHCRPRARGVRSSRWWWSSVGRMGTGRRPPARLRQRGRQVAQCGLDSTARHGRPGHPPLDARPRGTWLAGLRPWSHLSVWTRVYTGIWRLGPGHQPGAFRLQRSAWARGAGGSVFASGTGRRQRVERALPIRVAGRPATPTHPGQCTCPLSHVVPVTTGATTHCAYASADWPGLALKCSWRTPPRGAPDPYWNPRWHRGRFRTA